MTATKHDRSWLLACYKTAGKNFMTPHVLAKRVLVSKNTVVELSQGTGLCDRSPIYGVSVLVFDDDGKRIFPKPDVSKMFHDRQRAEAYYNDCV